MIASIVQILCIVCLSIIIVNQEAVKAQHCLQTGNGDGLPNFKDYRGDIGGDSSRRRRMSSQDRIEDNRITRGHQAIIPSYKFDCNQMCGNITEWGVDVHPGGMGHQNEYTLDLQVWRPSPTVDDSTGTSQYSLVGNNRFTSISLDSDQVAIVTPSPQDYIQFQPGDVLGFYVDCTECRINKAGVMECTECRDNPGVVVLTSPSSFTSEVVWFASIAPTLATSQTTYSIGSSGNLSTLTRAAPVISINTTTFSCTRPSVTTTLPTPPPQPTTDSNETPPRTTQEPQQPTVPQETTNSPNNDNGQIQTLSNSEVVTTTGVVSGVPTTSETISDQQISSGANIGLVVGIVVASILVIVLALALFAVAAVALTKRRKTENCFSSVSESRAISNMAYDTKDSSLKMEANGDYDYVVDGRGSLPVNSSSMTAPGGPVYQEADPYHSLGPDVSKKSTSSTVNKQAPPQSVVNEPTPAVYEVPDTHNKVTSSCYASPQAQDVFDVVGYHVPTTNERATWGVNHYEMDEKTLEAYERLDFFVEDQIYWAPASTTSDLYSQLASKKYREIPRNQLLILEELGSGEFGQVCKAVWSISGATKELAIKTLRAELPEEEKVRFLQEAAIMGQFSHPNVVKLYGVVTVGEPVMICIELLANGDLRGHLCSIVPQQQNSSELERKFLQFSKQIAAGMKCLSKKSFVHRDLAARNVLLDDMFNCKIADFGMARDLEDETYYTPKTKGGKIPVKWTAPEALHYKKYSTDSDVWSYGMVLFEIWSVGKKPFSRHTNNDVIRLLRSNYNQPPPPGCPRAIYKLMVDCWHPDHNKRPSFSKICVDLKTSPERLLHWSEQDSTAAPGARTLGGPLEDAVSLYEDLQNVYKTQ